MRLSEAIQQVFSKRPEASTGREIESILACMRFRLGMTHEESFERVRQQFPALDFGSFEEYCRRADDDAL